MCDKKPVQACSCCPKAFCSDHIVSEAVNADHPICHSGGCQMFICNFCQYNPERVNASYLHLVCLSQGCYPQELYTASGLWLSMYMKGGGPPLSARDFSAQCFQQDLAAFEEKVRTRYVCFSQQLSDEMCNNQALQGVSSCTRWIKAGRNPGAMYWLQPGTTLRSRNSVVFAGLHSLQQAVYFLPEESAMAIAVLVSQPVKREMVVPCSGHEAIQSMQITMQRIGSLRVVSSQHNMYTYHGVWMITSIDKQSEEQAAVTMFNMPG